MGTTAVTDNISATNESNTNNWPYTLATGLDPTIGIQDTIKELDQRIKMSTFEIIAQNLASYPSRDIYLASKIKERTYYIDGTKKIVLTIDRSIKNKVVKTLTGDTGSDTPLVKTVVRVPGTVTDKVYS